MNHRQYNTPAVILKRRNHSEADRILTVLTPELGKFDIWAKGVRKHSSKKRGHIELFTHINAHIVQGRWLPILTEAQTISHFQLKNPSTSHQVSEATSQTHLFHAYHLAEITDRLIPEHEPYPEVFQMLTTALKYLQTTDPNIHQLQRSFKLKLLQTLGFWPHGTQTPADLDAFLGSVLERPLRTSAFLPKT